MPKGLIILKPDAIARGLYSEILHRLNPFIKVTSAKVGVASKQLIASHYANLAATPVILERNIAFMTEGPILVLEVECNIDQVRAVVGATNPAKAAAGTIRGDLAADSFRIADTENRGTRNLIHASDSSESGRAEIALWEHAFHPNLEEQSSLIQKSLNSSLLTQNQTILAIPTYSVAFSCLYLDTCISMYKSNRKWLGGQVGLVADSVGNIYWRGTRIEHFSLASITRALLQEAAAALAADCRNLERLNVPVQMSTAGHPWFVKLPPTTPLVYRRALPYLQHWYKHSNGEVIVEVETRIQNGWPADLRYIKLSDGNVSLEIRPAQQASLSSLPELAGFKAACLPDNRPLFFGNMVDVQNWLQAAGAQEDTLYTMLALFHQNRAELR